MKMREKASLQVWHGRLTAPLRPRRDAGVHAEAGHVGLAVEKLPGGNEVRSPGRLVPLEEVEDLGIKLKRLQSVSQTSTQGEIHAKADLKDSIRYRPEIHLVDTLKKFNWKDPPWAFVDGVIDSGKVDLTISTNDTLIQLVHRVPKKFLFFKFGCKAIRQEIITKNPYNKIRYSEYIELK